MNIQAREVNTGGNSMVTIISSDSWDYVLITSDEVVTAYASEDDFWEGKDNIGFATIMP